MRLGKEVTQRMDDITTKEILRCNKDYFNQQRAIAEQTGHNIELYGFDSSYYVKAIDHALSCIDERNIAVQQLHDLGYELGEEVKPKDHKTVKELRAECEEYLDRDLSLEKKCKTVREMTPKEWLEEIIYSYGNGSTKLNRLYICSDLFILLQKIEKMENENE